MKEFWKNWKFWAVVVAVILILVAIICYFYCPKFTYFVSGLSIGALAGFIGGYFIYKKYGITKK